LKPRSETFRRFRRASFFYFLRQARTTLANGSRRVVFFIFSLLFNFRFKTRRRFRFVAFCSTGVFGRFPTTNRRRRALVAAFCRFDGGV